MRQLHGQAAPSTNAHTAHRRTTAGKPTAPNPRDRRSRIEPSPRKIRPGELWLVGLNYSEFLANFLNVSDRQSKRKTAQSLGGPAGIRGHVALPAQGWPKVAFRFLVSALLQAYTAPRQIHTLQMVRSGSGNLAYLYRSIREPRCEEYDRKQPQNLGF